MLSPNDCGLHFFLLVSIITIITFNIIYLLLLSHHLNAKYCPCLIAQQLLKNTFEINKVMCFKNKCAIYGTGRTEIDHLLFSDCVCSFSEIRNAICKAVITRFLQQVYITNVLERGQPLQQYRPFLTITGPPPPPPPPHTPSQ